MLIKSVASRFFIATIEAIEAIETIDAIDIIVAGGSCARVGWGDFGIKKKNFFKGLFARKNSYNFVG